MRIATHLKMMPLVALVGLLLSLNASAQAVREIVVTGQGSATAGADWIQVRGLLHRKSGLSGKAIRGYGKYRKRMLKKLKDAAIDGMTITPKGAKFSFTDRASRNDVVIFLGGGESTPDKEPRISISEQVLMQRKGLAGLKPSERRKIIGDIIQAARSAGLKFRDRFESDMNNPFQAVAMINGAIIRSIETSQSVPVNRGLSFGVDDGEKMQEEAINRAIAGAKRRAHQLAKSSGQKIGRLISLKVVEGQRLADSERLIVKHRVKVEARYAIK